MGSRATGQPQRRQPLGLLHLRLAKPRRGTTINKATTTSRELYCSAPLLAFAGGGLSKPSASKKGYVQYSTVLCCAELNCTVMWFATRNKACFGMLLGYKIESGFCLRISGCRFWALVELLLECLACRCCEIDGSEPSAVVVDNSPPDTRDGRGF